MSRKSLLHTLLLLTATSLSVSGCIGYFEDQPERYNTVSGGKRTPRLNPVSNQQNLPNDVTNAPRYQDMMVEPQGAALAEGIAGRTPDPTQPAPSPLYYYEQQQAAVTSSPLAAPNAAPVVASSDIQQPSPAPAAVDAALNDVMQSPEKSSMAETMPDEKMNASAETYPSLRNVPTQSAMQGQKMNDLQQNAQRFQDEYGLDPSLGEAQYKPEVPEAIEMEMTVEEATNGFDIEAENNAISAIQSTETQNVYGNYQPVPQPENAAADSVILDERALAGINLSQQPVAVAPSTPPASGNIETYVAPSNQNAMNAASAPSEIVSETTLDAVVTDAADPRQNMYSPQMQDTAPVQTSYYNPEDNRVVVPDAPVVAAPNQALLYGESGPIRLVPPSSISSRRGTLPESRYRNRRR